MTRALFLLAACGALCASAPAHAVYQCGPQKDDCYCGASDPYPCCENGGNCTWWAWEAACCHWGVALPGWGNAKQWAGNARAAGYRVEGWPVTGSIGCRATGTWGHVAWVTGIGGGGVSVQEQNCCTGCNYGMRNWSYGDYHWFDGGFITRAGQVQCRPGDSQTQGCGRCGAQSRGCGGNGVWGGWGGCGGEGPCSPGQVEQQACGLCGKRSRTCGGDCQWSGALGPCEGEGECLPGTKEERACGACGRQSRACGTSCGWEAWGECVGGGACVPGTIESEPCGGCASRTHTCDKSCLWGPYSECVPEIPSADLACETGGLGVCAAGEKRCVEDAVECVALAAPSTETCNGLDDDCDGVIDQGLACAADAGAAIPPGDAGTGAATAAGCGCVQGVAGQGAWLAFLALAGLRRRLRK